MLFEVHEDFGAESRGEVKLSQQVGILIGMPGGKLDAPRFPRASLDGTLDIMERRGCST